MVSRSLPLRGTSPRLLSIASFFYHLLAGLFNFFIPERLKWADVSGQTVLITGAGSGIGQLMALRFLALGCKVVCWDVNAAGLEETRAKAAEAEAEAEHTEHTEHKDLKDRLQLTTINLTKREAIYAAARALHADPTFGPSVDILINNAGVVSGTALLDTSDEAIQLTFEVNALAHFTTIKAFLPEMIAQKRGHIVTIASVAGHLASASLTDYCASKFANVGLDLALRVELAQANLSDVIHTSIVKPFFISTGMFEGSRSDLVPFLQPAYVADCIVSGVRARTQDIIIPYYLVVLFQLVQVLPTRCSLALVDLLGGYEAMTHFTGRRGKATTPLSGDGIGNGNGKEMNNNENGSANSKKVD